MNTIYRVIHQEYLLEHLGHIRFVSCLYDAGMIPCMKKFR